MTDRRQVHTVHIDTQAKVAWVNGKRWPGVTSKAHRLSPASWMRILRLMRVRAMKNQGKVRKTRPGYSYEGR